MNTLALSWRYLWSRPLAAALKLLLMTLGRPVARLAKHSQEPAHME